MTDREMLELAARAAGRKLEWVGDQPTVPYTQEQSAARAGVHGYCWNPLTDDGDALRLAVRLRLHIAPGETGVEVFRYGFMLWEHEPYGSDPDAATRLAILRCAAEVGSRMP